MTEKEREELIEQMARDIGAACGYRITPWRYRIVKAHARAALAVAEPVIREQCANDALKRCFFCPAEVAAAIREGGNE